MALSKEFIIVIYTSFRFPKEHCYTSALLHVQYVKNYNTFLNNDRIRKIIHESNAIHSNLAFYTSLFLKLSFFVPLQLVPEQSVQCFVHCAIQQDGQCNANLSMMHCAKKDTIHQVTTMLATCKNVLFPGHNHLLTTSSDGPSLAGTRAIIKVSGHQYWWLAGGYDALEIRHF